MWGTNQTEKLKVNIFTPKHGLKTLSDWKYNITEWNVVIFSKQYPPWTRFLGLVLKLPLKNLRATAPNQYIYWILFVCLLIIIHYCSRFLKKNLMIKENQWSKKTNYIKSITSWHVPIFNLNMEYRWFQHAYKVYWNSLWVDTLVLQNNSILS